jgi:hypothetical protein
MVLWKMSSIISGLRVSISKHNKVILLSSVIVIILILAGYFYISASSNMANSSANSLQNFEYTLELDPENPKVLDLVTISVNIRFDKVGCLDGAYLNKFLDSLGINLINLTIIKDDSIYLQRNLPIYNKVPDDNFKCINIDKLTISYFNVYFYKNGSYKILLEINGKIRKTFTREITVMGSNNFPSSIEISKHNWMIRANVTPKLNSNEELVIIIVFEYKGNDFILKQVSMPFLKSVYILSDKGDSWSIYIPSIIMNHLNVYHGYKSEFKFAIGKNSEFKHELQSGFYKINIRALIYDINGYAEPLDIVLFSEVI